MSTRSLTLLLVFIPCMLSAQGVLYQEEFTGGTADNAWFAGFNGNTMEVANWPGNPSGDGWVGSLGNHFSGGNVGESHSGDPEMANYYYEAHVYIPVDEAVYYGLEFRVDTAGLSSGYQFVARFRPGGMVSERLRFRVRPPDNPGMPTVIRDWEADDIPGGIPQESGWHLMAVLCQNHSFTFWFDGQELPGCPVNDFSILKGAIGAYIWDTSTPTYLLHIDDINVSTEVTSVSYDGAAHVRTPVLHQNYPNPVSRGTNISFDLPERMYVRLSVYSLQGRKVADITEGMQDAGAHTAAWNATGLPAGSYMIRLHTPQGVQSRQCVVLR
ncbi:T9SS type A sorting domain-containing protein [bacterium]|nr:T9SS type A sorting domain-containing protein [bacterium]